MIERGGGEAGEENAGEGGEGKEINTTIVLSSS